LLGVAPADAREEAVFGEDCYGVYEEDGDYRIWSEYNSMGGRAGSITLEQTAEGEEQGCHGR